MSEKILKESSFLFAMPSFWNGVARLMDLGGVFDRYNISRSPEEADAWALWNDFHAVGRDLQEARDRALGQKQEKQAA